MDLNAVRSSQTIGISASTTSANAALPTGGANTQFINGILIATNPNSSAAALVVSETAGPVAAFPGTTPSSCVIIPPGSAIAIGVNPTQALFAAVILASGSGTVFLTVGQRL